MALKAYCVVVGMDVQSDNTFRVRLDIDSGELSVRNVLSGVFEQSATAGYVNSRLLVFVRDYILEEWGVTTMVSDTIKLLRPVHEALFVVSLARRQPTIAWAGW